MNPDISLDPEFSARFAMTLAHFLWQGAALGLAVFLLGIVLRRASARLRYGVFLAALLAMALCPALTFSLLEPGTGEGFAAVLPGGQPDELGGAESAAASGISVGSAKVIVADSGRAPGPPSLKASTRRHSGG